MSPFKCLDKNRRAAFTLIELLVVITITAVMVALLLPSLGKAKEAAIHIRCAGQLHQHGISMSAYQADNRNYYPPFGGTPANDYADWYRTPVYGVIYAIDNNKGTQEYFGPYLNNTKPGLRKLQQVDYCPAIDWASWGKFVFGLGYTFGSFQASLPGAYAGYNFYPGQKFYVPGGNPNNLDTRVRRDDPREVLATDVLVQVVPWLGDSISTYNGQPLDESSSVPWFNPHSGNSNTIVRTGGFHQLVASGAVAQYRFDTESVITFGANNAFMMANTTFVVIPDSMDNGGYFRGP
jgi:prepilin-type N-terminal cleavage/methylation domain-containing protein